MMAHLKQGSSSSAALKQRLRLLFEATIFNYGDYNLIYAHPVATGPAFVIGYRRQPLEMVLLPIVTEEVEAVGAHTEADREDILTIDLSNVAMVSDSGAGYGVTTVTDHRAHFDVVGDPEVPLGAGYSVALEQFDDSEDFHEFMTELMDQLDELYKRKQDQ
ncbi:hypothetical protein [Auritidibacter ignavus]|uniref:hypothetical protein n=1 Tax=Auritidibacter ignavus TaxID=678932 RepID=UPI002446DB7A|nr:hypothetical protein [Auritidibacter ignavus]WGH84093.1 hypothetical protein QDX20_00625 [Auritidibacter ignavus]WHS28233.1 hypothetical protein QM395_00380 [Auritidibacter ignavus]WHS35130.1 hypothetical protein QM403_00765 [Auritidibacter ignavus]